MFRIPICSEFLLALPCRGCAASQPLVHEVVLYGLVQGLNFLQPTTARSSWRSTAAGTARPAVGYRIMTLRVLPNGTVASYDVFAEGWLQNPGKRQFWGAPVLWANSAACIAAGLICIAEQPCSDLTRCTLPR